MTEDEWLACTDSMRMLRSIRDKVSHRKEALFTCACCHRLWVWLSDECRRQVGVMGRYAEDPGQPDVGGEEFESAFMASQAAAPEPVRGAFDALLLAACGYWRVEAVAETEQEALADPAWLHELEGQAPLVRDIIGNPFRPARIDPVWLAWSDGTVVKLAQAIYDDRAFDRLPVLADALLDAGCEDADLLGHLRGPGPHVRGCWVVDLLLGKE
jgi:hypothetical protein